jgi:hypothetical protein
VCPFAQKRHTQLEKSRVSKSSNFCHHTSQRRSSKRLKATTQSHHSRSPPHLRSTTTTTPQNFYIQLFLTADFAVCPFAQKRHTQLEKSRVSKSSNFCHHTSQRRSSKRLKATIQSHHSRSPPHLRSTTTTTPQNFYIQLFLMANFAVCPFASISHTQLEKAVWVKAVIFTTTHRRGVAVNG